MAAPSVAPFLLPSVPAELSTAALKAAKDAYHKNKTPVSWVYGYAYSLRMAGVEPWLADMEAALRFDLDVQDGVSVAHRREYLMIACAKECITKYTPIRMAYLQHHEPNFNDMLFRTVIGEAKQLGELYLMAAAATSVMSTPPPPPPAASVPEWTLDMDNKIVRGYRNGLACDDIARDLGIAAGLVQLRHAFLTRKRKTSNRTPVVVEDSASSCSSSSEEEEEEEASAQRRKKARLEPPSHVQAALTR